MLRQISTQNRTEILIGTLSTTHENLILRKIRIYTYTLVPVPVAARSKA